MFPKGDSTPTEIDRTNKEDFVEACIKAGYSVNTKNGQSGILAAVPKVRFNVQLPIPSLNGG
jgi:hypothetical protein